MILLVDNYDSFVHNLARYFARLGQQTVVVRNDALTAREVREMAPRAIVISPGPCAPRQAGSSLELIREFHQEIPVLGVCLGHQAIAEALGGTIVRAPEPVHGRTSQIVHAGTDLFAGLPNPLLACRYHSLLVERDTLPDCLRVTAETADGLIMALRHRERPVFGVQFHPESILTDFGFPMLANFLQAAGLDVPECPPTIDNERATENVDRRCYETPVTF